MPNTRIVPADVALTSDARIVAMGGYHDGTVHQWETATGKELWAENKGLDQQGVAPIPAADQVLGKPVN